MQPVDTGRSIVRCHESSEYLLCLRDSSWSGIWDLNVLEAELAVSLFVEAVLRRKASVLLMTALRRKLAL